MIFADDPGFAVAGAVGFTLGHVALAAAQLHQLSQAPLQGAVADQAAVVQGLLLGLVLQQGPHRRRRQAAGQGLHQAQGKLFAAIGKQVLALVGEPPAVARPAGTLGAQIGLHQAFLLQAAQVAPHHLHRHAQALGQFGCRASPMAHQQGQGGLSGGNPRGLGASWLPLSGGV